MMDPTTKLTDNKRCRSPSLDSSNERPPRKEQRLEEGASESIDSVGSLSLSQLVDCSALASPADIASRFKSLAQALLCDYTIQLTYGNTREEFEILELECYLQKSECHEDPFTHGNEEQRLSGNWYFHRAPTRSANPVKQTAASGYRGGTRKGLDLTIAGAVASPHFASPDDSSFRLRGGVLLRTIRRVSDSAVISGPSLLVDEILRLSKASNIAELVEKRMEGNTAALPPASSTSSSKSSLLHLSPKTPTKNTAKPTIYCSSRIGLDLSNPSAVASPTNPRVIYISKPYRYFTHPHLLTSNGRGHTFHGLYQSCLNQSNSEAAVLAEIIKLSGLKEVTAQKYLADYKLGLEKGSLQAFIGAAGKGAASSPSSYLKMMGTLDRLNRPTT